MTSIREYIESAKEISNQHLGEVVCVMWRRKSRPKIIRGQAKRDADLGYNWFTVAECLDGEILYADKRYA